MDKSLEDWEREFVKSEDIQSEDLKKLLDKGSRFSEIQADGYVRIKKNGKKEFSDKTQIQLILIARYLANALQTRLGRENPIPASVTVSEFVEMIKRPEKSVTSRLSDLRKEHAIDDVARGEYKIKLSAIEDFLDNLVKTYGESD
jgi:hypothetical protein